uniref:Secreted protein n=1 Tax=Ixodes ricinus TaxID=34613 RepID=A0A6B0VAQ2_IXORI
MVVVLVRGDLVLLGLAVLGSDLQVLVQHAGPVPGCGQAPLQTRHLSLLITLHVHKLAVVGAPEALTALAQGQPSEARVPLRVVQVLRPCQVTLGQGAILGRVRVACHHRVRVRRLQGCLLGHLDRLLQWGKLPVVQFKGQLASLDNLLGLLSELALGPVELHAVLVQQLHVVEEVVPVVVLVRLDVLDNAVQVDGVFDDIVVVLDKLLVDGFVEGPRLRDALEVVAHDALQDVGQRHLVVVVQKRVDGLLQPHQLVLLLRKALQAQLQHVLGSLGQRALQPIVELAVLDDLVDVCEELLAALVPLLMQLLADSLQVHRDGHNLVVVRHRLGTHGVPEGLRLWKVPHLIEDGLEGDGEGDHGVRAAPVGALVGLAQVVAVQHRARTPPLLQRHRLLGELEHQRLAPDLIRVLDQLLGEHHPRLVHLDEVVVRQAAALLLLLLFFRHGNLHRG